MSAKSDLKLKGKSLEEAIARQRRQQLALELRKQGKSYREIAAMTGTSGQTAKNDVLHAIQDARGGDEEDNVLVRDLELERCDTMMQALWGKVLGGDLSAIETTLKIMGRRSDYLGLDAPRRTEFLGAVATLTPDNIKNLSDEELASRTKQLLEHLTGVKHDQST